MIIESKLIEVRDAGTFIPALAVRVVSDSGKDAYLLRRAGYGGMRDDAQPYILFMKIDGGNTAMQYDPYAWGGGTMYEAHKILIERWQDFDSGDVLDVQFELGETQERKKSEALSDACL